ncbi:MULTISPECIES: TonB-dependent siderophore receptor [unclassified Pseudoalteromonas]|uniref:TonB-dependent siderophore receptor n=1 Tax=unclassified Pseudoalteromonas TaxID=194690 RepID=UPI00110863F0|nr:MULTISPECIES: TonB-dependent siderophore receptor [unclassified Pseudoalteromonas]TMN85932.1 TonB-dependent siderophore receptor [Pseudoalteromonas sp. S410]TMN93260.1 TonB-dependent siderophore receptor [Pseudoalteromonas sp. S408]TMN99751.1 TonB-dependent siderophore receptor [Pseudoalteromonas sp. S407]TMO00527.1 TonB-dependent siderophore receptor [Pseudoalteromonas sp. S409]TMO12540.1 TonB-dependent siderophore receptor [Pseudoalteromonas sp. S186]
MSSPTILRLSKLSLVSSLILSGYTFADEENTKGDPLEKIAVYGQHHKNYITEEAQSATKLGLSIKETPQSISVVSRALMDDFSLDNINAVLESTPGVTVEQIETDRTYFKARGFEITNFQVDGLGIPQSSGSIQGTLDTSIYDRVEIVRGANGLMTGAGNPSATVNMVLKKPTYITQAHASASYGSWNNKRLELDVSSPINDEHAVRAVFTKQQAESYLDRYETDKTIGYLAYEGKITNDTTLSLNYVNQQKDADSPLWGALPLYYTDGSATDYDSSTSTASDWSYWDNSAEQVYVTLEQNLSTTWVATARYAHIKNEQDSELFYVYGTPDKETGLGLTGYASRYDYEDKHDLFDLYASGKFDLFGLEHDLSFGVSQANMDYTEQSLYDYTTGNGFPAMPSLDSWDGVAPEATLADGLNGSDIENKQQSAYVSTRIKLSAPLSILAGVRYTDWETKGTAYGVAQTRDDSEVIPYVGAVYDFTESLSAYASYTETFVPQNELDINAEQLAPITGKSSEIGLKAQLLDDQVFLTLAYFDAKQEGLAVALPDSLPSDTRYYGAEGINSDGFEIELSGKLTEDLSASISFSNLSIEGDDLVKDYTPENQLKVAATYQVPLVEGLTFGANYRWQDSVSRVQVSDPTGAALVTTNQGAYGILDLMANYKITQNVGITFNINNTTDEKYLHSLYWAQGYYGAPRNYALSVNWQL